MNDRWLILEMAGNSICSISLPVSQHTQWRCPCFSCRIGSGEKRGPKTTGSTVEEWTRTETGKWNGVVSSRTLSFSRNPREILRFSLTHAAHSPILSHTGTFLVVGCWCRLLWLFISVNCGKNICVLTTICVWCPLISGGRWLGGFCWVLISLWVGSRNLS